MSPRALSLSPGVEVLLPVIELDIVEESFLICMQRQTFSIPGSVSNALKSAIRHAGIYLPLFIPSSVIALPSLEAISDFFFWSVSYRICSWHS